MCVETVILFAGYHSSLQLHTTQAVQNHSYMHEQSLLLREDSVYKCTCIYFLPVTVILLHE